MNAAPDRAFAVTRAAATDYFAECCLKRRPANAYGDMSTGDKAAAQELLGTLMARHGDDIYRYAQAMTRDSTLAEEVRQQVFVEAYFGLLGESQPRSVASWLFGIARHRCLDALRARERWQHRYKNELSHEPSCDREEQTQVENERVRKLLAACLGRLAPAAREAVILRYQQDLSYDEAADALGAMPATIRRRVSRALPILRRCVEAKLQGGAT